jgi:hypothetical protein
MITLAELVPLYLTALAVTLPLIAFRTWRRGRILTLDLRKGQ